MNVIITNITNGNSTTLDNAYKLSEGDYFLAGAYEWYQIFKLLVGEKIKYIFYPTGDLGLSMTQTQINRTLNRLLYMKASGKNESEWEQLMATLKQLNDFSNHTKIEELL